ncbi:MAG TPA: hypothetical protein VF727_11960 [Allosphingosinicella sp.]|jgi:hypothetical protein
MEGERDRQLRDDLLGPLHTHFLAAAQAYADYMANGKSFLFACSLRRTNASARALLLRRTHLLPEALQPHAIALLRHYDVWLTLWDDLAARTKPGFADPFVFENAVNFPRESQQRLDELRRSLSA